MVLYHVCGGSGFTLLLSEWFFIMCVVAVGLLSCSLSGSLPVCGGSGFTLLLSEWFFIMCVVAVGLLSCSLSGSLPVCGGSGFTLLLSEWFFTCVWWQWVYSLAL